jgi:hypothetical protein
LSKNSHKTQVVVAIIGVIGVIAGGVITNWDKIFPERTAELTARNADEQHPSTPTASGTQDPKDTGIPDCFAHYFSGIARERIGALETGAKDFQIIGPHQSKDHPIGIQLRENRQPVGAVRVQFYFENTIFKIESLVDSQCQPVEDYVNKSRGGDKHILQNWDDLQVRLGKAMYTLTLEYDAGKIDADFARISP